MFASKVVKHISPSANMIILKQITKLARIKKKLKKYVQMVIGSTKIKSPIKNTSTLIQHSPFVNCLSNSYKTCC